MSESIKVSKHTKESLLRVAARLQERVGRRVDLDEAVAHLLMDHHKRSDLLERVFASVPKLAVKELYRERRLDEARARRKFAI